jgi:hypothetical protein
MNRFLLFILPACLALTLRSLAAGIWVPLANSPPGDAGHFLLLSDGTVIAEDLSTNYGPGWFRLTPDIHGSYVNGTWSTIVPMRCTRLDFSSVVLTNGSLFVASGEYGPGTTNAEIYNPVGNSWTELTIPARIITTNNQPYSDGQNSAGFSDCNSILLGNGCVLMTPVFPATNGNTAVYDPVANSWTTPALVRGYDEDEATLLKLPDDSILVIDSSWPAGIPSTNSERFIPALNQWINDSNVPVSLYDNPGLELGPAMLLPNGKGIFFGANSNTAIYTPSGTTNAGSWAAGPNFPNAQGMPDAPAAMLVNGKILCTVEQVATNSAEWYPPVSFYEYDYLSNRFAQVSAPGGSANFNDYCYPTLMLELPDGTVLFGHRSTDFYVYQPDGVPLAAGQPVITSITTNRDGSLHLTGTLFNGLCQGASYGDDEQMDSNFPLVRFTDTSGNVRYGRTYNWSCAGVFKTNLIVTSECTVPAGVSLLNTVQVVANGIASAGMPFNFPASYAVTNTADSGAGSLRQAIADSLSGGTITFAPWLSGSTITLTNGELPLTGNLTIDASALTNGIRLDGNNASRIFNVAAGVTVDLNSLTLTNGHSDANDWGGALINNGTLALTNCTLAGNLIDGGGSGGAIENAGALILAGCTLSDNAAGYAGAIRNESTCALQNCTFYGNAVAGNGGAIDNVFGATLNVLHCTFSSNSAGSSGAGIDNYLSQVNLTNSILAGNTGQDIYNWGGSTVTAAGSNLVQSLVNGGGTVIGTVIAANPLLAPLGNYGGPTQTMPPLLGSPAVDQAAATTLNHDQRGFPRPLGLAPDIGAVEGIYNSAGPGRLTGPTRLDNGSFQFGFTNYTDTSFTVLGTTNLALPLNRWWNLGATLEMPVGSGQFQFTDPQATNHAQRYYRVSSP